jgi:hypothetical protein
VTQEQLSTGIPGVNVMLMGPGGTGKTFSIGTLVDSGVKVRYLGLEPGVESLLAYFKDRGQDIPPNLAWHTLAAPKASFTELMDSANKINTMQLDTLAKMQDPNRSKHNQFIKMLEALNDFPDDRTGQKLGCADSWGTDCALVVDGMAGLARAAMSLVVGGKPVKNQSDWGIAQDQIEKIVRLWTDHCKCHFVLIAHVEREQDAILGGIKLMVSTLGKALAPKLPPMFSDVILTERSGSNFTWNTGSAMADVKTRNLTISEKLPADFKVIIEKWKSRGGVL